MKTAMQELIDEVRRLRKNGFSVDDKYLQGLLEKEKEQIIDAYKQACGYEYEYIDNESLTFKEQAEEYYNQTYNHNK
jgi:hypothetical protein